MEIILAVPGDTILTLQNPNAPFAPWEGDSKPGPRSSTTPSPAPPPVLSSVLPPTPSPTLSPAPPPVLSPVASPTPPPITFRLSSRHLIQASAVFKAALTGGWKEGSTAAGGCYEINAEDWDAEAMRVVLSLVHSRTKAIPRSVTLEMLSKIAVLVDYYELHEAVHFYASLWIDTLRNSLPRVYGRDLILWICVSWIFKDASIFQAVTKLVIEHSPGKVPTIQLPIPEKVIGKLSFSGALLRN